MSNEGGSQADRDLLARLSALKKTHIDLDDKQYQIPVTAHIQSPLDSSPAKSLHDDLLSRFKSLSGTQSRSPTGDATTHSSSENVLAEEDSKTIEELLSELGGEGAWNIEKDEATQIDDLLRSANTTLKEIKSREEMAESDDLKPGNDTTHELPSLYVEFSKPDTNTSDQEEDDEDQSPRKSKKDLEADIDREADSIIARLRDELKNSPPSPDPDPELSQDQNSSLPAPPTFDLPAPPSKDPEPAATTVPAENDLASRFASLSLPSAPSTKPSSSSAATTKYGTSAKHAGHTDEEIDSWCIICCEDATLRCLGCDGDLYCAKCWVEGHRGPDAGYEEQRHKAVEFHRGVKKVPRRRVAA